MQLYPPFNVTSKPQLHQPCRSITTTMFCSSIIPAAAAQLQRPPTTAGDRVYSLIILPLLLLMLMLMLMPLLPMAMEQPQGGQRRLLMSYC